MSLELLQAAANSNHWVAIAPELILACAALFLLVLEIVPVAAVMAFVGVLIGLIITFKSVWIGETTFSGLIRHSMSGQIARVFFVISGLFVCFLAGVCLPRSRMPRVEFYHIVMICTAAMMLLAQSDHFVMFFVALETLTIGLYILVSYYRDRPLTLEAGLKYLVSGSLSSAILLFGIVMLYGAVGRVEGADGFIHTGFEFPVVAAFLEQHPDSFLGIAGALLVLSGVAFKIGAFPFQIWIPDVYQGAPTPTTAFLAVSSKAAGFAILLILVRNVFGALEGIIIPVLSAMTVATLLFGNLAALSQRNAKRLMGLSGVSHAGFLLLGVVASFTVPWAGGAVWFYLYTYLFASMAVFGVMAHVAGEDDADQSLDRYDRLAKDQPFLAGILAIGVGSLAGIPPLAGFMGKLLVFLAAVQAELYGLLAVAIVCVVISIYFYFGWIKAAWFETWRAPSDTTSAPAVARSPTTVFGSAVLGSLALATVVLGFFQEPLTRWLTMK
jgi:NADH-quinone oxidoreductase subunit N